MQQIPNNTSNKLYHLPSCFECFLGQNKVFFFCFLRHSLALSPMLECGSMISAHCNLCFLGARDPHASASQAAGITGTHYQLFFVLLVEAGFCHGGQAGFKLLTSGDPLPRPLKVLG